MTEQSPMRAGDDDRQTTVRRLERAMVEGQLSIDEMEERMGQAYRANTWDQLDRLTADLPTATAEPAAPATRPVGSWHVSLLGDVRRGGWIAPERDLRGLTFLGDVTFDLSSADFPPEGVEVFGATLLGDVRVVVPDGARVRFSGFNLLGDRSELLTPPAETGPLITVRAFTLLGDVHVYSRSLVPESALKRWWLKVRGVEPGA